MSNSESKMGRPTIDRSGIFTDFEAGLRRAAVLDRTLPAPGRVLAVAGEKSADRLISASDRTVHRVISEHFPVLDGQTEFQRAQRIAEAFEILPALIDGNVLYVPEGVDVGSLHVDIFPERQ